MDIHLKACWIICSWKAASFSSRSALASLPSASSDSDPSAVARGVRYSDRYAPVWGSTKLAERHTILD